MSIQNERLNEVTKEAKHAAKAVTEEGSMTDSVTRARAQILMGLLIRDGLIIAA